MGSLGPEALKYESFEGKGCDTRFRVEGQALKLETPAPPRIKPPHPLITVSL